MLPEDVERETRVVAHGRTGERPAPRWRGPFVQGEVIDGIYRVDQLLGAGGMGVVYLARDLRIGRNVALKVASDPRYTHVLRREAQALATVRHPGVITVYGMGSFRDQEYLVLEHLLGRTLQARLDEGGHHPLSIGEVLDVGIGISDALSAAHRAGLAHRDLKPDNVFVCGARVVLLDFGLFIPECEVADHGQIAGCAEFMAPEVITNRVVPGAGPLVDLYALGVILFELVAGRTPFADATDSLTLRRHLSEVPPDLTTIRPDVPDALARLVAGLLEKSPLDRVGSAEAVLWQLCAINGEGARGGVRPFRILVVDDDPAIGKLLRRSLKQALPQLVIEVEDDPRQALLEIERERPDLVLMDLNMPGMNGIELMMQLSALPRRPRVVGMSAAANDRDLAVLRALGVVDFAAKDLSFVSHVSTIVAELRHH